MCTSSANLRFSDPIKKYVLLVFATVAFRYELSVCFDMLNYVKYNTICTCLLFPPPSLFIAKCGNSVSYFTTKNLAIFL